MTEQEELYEVYGLQCISIPTARPRIRVDAPPAMYLTRSEADDVISEEVQIARAAQQPVLIGTSSVEESNAVLRALKLRWEWRVCARTSYRQVRGRCTLFGQTLC